MADNYILIYDAILSFLRDYDDTQVTIQNIYRMIPNSETEYCVEELLAEGLIKRVHKPYQQHIYLITFQGRNVLENGGYKPYYDKLDSKRKRTEHKDELEYLHLKQSVRLNKWQFWIMIIGSIGGLISFLFVVFQFIFGDRAFIDILFNRFK